MSISGALAASSRIGVASGVQCFSPARLRNRPVTVWVRGSMGRCRTTYCKGGMGGKGGKRALSPRRTGKSRWASRSREGKRCCILELAAALVNRAAKVLVEGVKRIGLQFGERSPQLLFNTVDGVEEGAPIDPELAAAEFPVRTQEVMISKHLVIEIVQHTPAHQAEVGHEFFPFAGVGTPALRARA